MLHEDRHSYTTLQHRLTWVSGAAETGGVTQACVSTARLGCASAQDFTGCSSCPSSSRNSSTLQHFLAPVTDPVHSLHLQQCRNCSGAGCAAGACQDGIGCTGDTSCAGLNAFRLTVWCGWAHKSQACVNSCTGVGAGSTMSTLLLLAVNQI